MIDDVLLACDFSPSSKRAVAYAVDLVERAGATLHLMHIQEVAMGPFVGGEPSPEAGGRKILEEFEEESQEVFGALFRPLDDDRITYTVERSGSVAPALVQYAQEHSIDLIGMGTHGRRGVERVLFGSVAEEVLRTAPCPVLTSRVKEEQSAPDLSITQVVVPIDFSDPSKAALQYASRLAALYDAPLTLAHIIQLPSIPTVYQAEISDLSPQEIEARVRTELKEWAHATPSPHQEPSYAVESGDPVPTILELASTPHDLVVMATHGLSGLKRRVLGSVAEGVLRQASGPVISGRAFPLA